MLHSIPYVVVNTHCLHRDNVLTQGKRQAQRLWWDSFPTQGGSVEETSLIDTRGFSNAHQLVEPIYKQQACRTQLACL